MYLDLSNGPALSKSAAQCIGGDQLPTPRKGHHKWVDAALVRSKQNQSKIAVDISASEASDTFSRSLSGVSPIPKAKFLPTESGNFQLKSPHIILDASQRGSVRGPGPTQSVRNQISAKIDMENSQAIEALSSAKERTQVCSLTRLFIYLLKMF